MATTINSLQAIKDAYRLAGEAAVPTAPWLLVFVAAVGLYGAASTLAVGWAGWAGLAVVFAAAIRYSLALFRQMMGVSTGSLQALAFANFAAAAAQFFVSFFIVFFIAAFGVMMLQMSGLVDLAKETTPEQFAAAQAQLYQTPYGLTLLVVVGLGALAMAYIALRLILVGPATTAEGGARVFRTWDVTKGHFRSIALAAIATHALPFALYLVVSDLVSDAVGGGSAGGAMAAAIGAIALVPFLLAGHGLAVSVYRVLAPRAT